MFTKMEKKPQPAVTSSPFDCSISPTSAFNFQLLNGFGSLASLTSAQSNAREPLQK
jgi:hypothetical protein